MTPRAFCASGNCEQLKGAAHAATALLLGTMATYNAVAWLFRGDRHLAANTAIYVAATFWEVRKTSSHWTP